MVQELKFGLMVQSMKENGQKIKQMERESFGMQMVTYTKVTGLMTRPMGMVPTFI